MFEIVIHFLSNYLIEFMGVLLILALIFRFLAARAIKMDKIYFSSFAREIDKNIDDIRNGDDQIKDVDKYLNELMNRLDDKLPNRSLRFMDRSRKQNKIGGGKNLVSLKDYLSGQRSLLASIRNEASAFKCVHPPNFRDLTSRILNQDRNWVGLFGVIPIDGLSRMIDVLPGLFIVFGVFGTFVGISQALPEIAKIDFNNIEASGNILSNFVSNVTFAMRTSVAGILFSLIMTILNTMFPIKGPRNQIFSKVSNSFESMWYSIHGQKSLEQHLSENLPEFKEIISKMEHNLNYIKENIKTNRSVKKGA